MTVNYRAAKATERLLCVTGIPRGDNRSVAFAARVNAADSGRPSLSVGLGVGLYGPFHPWL